MISLTRNNPFELNLFSKNLATIIVMRVISILMLTAVILSPQAVFAGSLVDAIYKQGIEAYQAKNYTVAFKHMREAADANDMRAQYKLGVMYEYGRGIPISPELASFWYDKSAKSGNAQAQYALGTFYLTGKGVAKSERLAVDLYRNAADQGHAMAQMKLKTIYIDGNRADYRPSQKLLESIEKKSNLLKMDAILLVRQMFMDNGVGADRLSTVQTQILNTLSDTESTSYDVTYQGTTFILPPATPETIHYLSYFTGKFSFNDIWLKDNTKMVDLIDVYVTAPKTQKRAKNFVSSKVYKSWQNSSISNGYKPVRDVITDYYKLVDTLSEPQRTNAQQLLYYATKDVDIYVQDIIPDFVYNWVCHEPCQQTPKYRLKVD